MRCRRQKRWRRRRRRKRGSGARQWHSQSWEREALRPTAARTRRQLRASRRHPRQSLRPSLRPSWPLRRRSAPSRQTAAMTRGPRRLLPQTKTGLRRWQQRRVARTLGARTAATTAAATAATATATATTPTTATATTATMASRRRRAMGRPRRRRRASGRGGRWPASRAAARRLVQRPRVRRAASPRGLSMCTCCLLVRTARQSRRRIHRSRWASSARSSARATRISLERSWPTGSSRQSRTRHGTSANWPSSRARVA